VTFSSKHTIYVIFLANLPALCLQNEPTQSPVHTTHLSRTWDSSCSNDSWHAQLLDRLSFLRMFILCLCF